MIGYPMNKVNSPNTMNIKLPTCTNPRLVNMFQERASFSSSG